MILTAILLLLVFLIGFARGKYVAYKEIEDEQ
jgi:uncharacterized protein YneF (UPF0154 family)